MTATFTWPANHSYWQQYGPNMSYIFEKQRVQWYQIWWWRVKVDKVDQDNLDKLRKFDKDKMDKLDKVDKDKDKVKVLVPSRGPI